MTNHHNSLYSSSTPSPTQTCALTQSLTRTRSLTQDYVEIIDGKVTLCRYAAQSRCTRPKCKFYHPPASSLPLMTTVPLGSIPTTPVVTSWASTKQSITSPPFSWSIPKTTRWKKTFCLLVYYSLKRKKIWKKNNINRHFTGELLKSASYYIYCVHIFKKCNVLCDDWNTFFSWCQDQKLAKKKLLGQRLGQLLLLCCL